MCGLWFMVHLVRCVAFLKLAVHYIIPLPHCLVLLALRLLHVRLLQQLQRRLLVCQRLAAQGSSGRLRVEVQDLGFRV